MSVVVAESAALSLTGLGPLPSAELTGGAVADGCLETFRSVEVVAVLNVE